jgi:hypothetical protein
VRSSEKKLHGTTKQLREHPIARFVPELMRSVDEFAGSQPQFGDVTAVLINTLARKPDHVSTADIESAWTPARPIQFERIEQKHDG